MVRGGIPMAGFWFLAGALMPAFGQGGVEAYPDQDFKGEKAVMLEDQADLANHPLLGKGFESIRIPASCTVVAFAEKGFAGTARVLRGDHPRIEWPWPGETGSILIHWHTEGVANPSPMLRTDGIILFSEIDFRGTSEVFEEDDSNLNNNASAEHGFKSIRIPNGYAATFFEKKRFRGPFATIDQDRARLDLSGLGLKSVESIMISWMDTSVPEAERRRVLLYEDTGFDGREEGFFTDDPDLRDNAIGSNRASSIRVPEGCTVILYSERHYRGVAVELHASSGNLRNTVVGNDQVSSIRIFWDR